MGMKDVKLQILLKRAMRSDEIALIEELLAKVGAAVTGRGSLTLSATIPREQFEKVFSKKFEGQSGFTSERSMGTTLPLPPELKDYIDTISETPPHLRMSD